MKVSFGEKSYRFRGISGIIGTVLMTPAFVVMLMAALVMMVVMIPIILLMLPGVAVGMIQAERIS